MVRLVGHGLVTGVVVAGRLTCRCGQAAGGERERGRREMTCGSGVSASERERVSARERAALLGHACF
jgi:hypothetical protein